MFVNCSGQEVSVFSFIDAADRSTSPHLFYTLYGVEHFFVQVLNFVALYLLYLSRKIKIWHTNLTIIAAFFVSTVFWCTTGRVSILILNVVGMGEDNCSDVYRVAAFLQVLYALICIHLLPSIVFERLMAYHFLEDYERKSRLYIPAIVIVISFTIGFTVTLNMDMRFFTATFLIYTLALNSVFFALFVVLWKKNSDRLQVIDFDGKYTLSKRFQLVENLKVFKLLRNVIVVIVILVSILASFKIAVPSFYLNGVKYDSYLVSIMIWAQTIILIVAIWSIEVWRDFTTSLFPWNKQQLHPLVKVVPLSEEAGMYFAQLNKSWMNPPEKIHKK